MVRGKAYRRHADALAKKKARNKWINLWNIKDEPTPRQIGIMANTVMLCSCYACSIKRKYEGAPYQEAKLELEFEEELKEIYGEHHV